MTSDAHLAAIVASSDDAVISMTLDGQIESWNRGAERIYGYTADETVGRNIALLVRARSRRRGPGDSRARLARGERIDHYETVLQRKDGSLIDVSVTVSPVVNSSGTVIGASSVSRDVTEHKKAETIAARLAAIVDSADDAMTSVTLDGRVVSWNRWGRAVVWLRGGGRDRASPRVRDRAWSRGRDPGDSRAGGSRRADRALRDRPQTQGRDVARCVDHGVAGPELRRKGHRRIGGRSRRD